MQKIMAMGRVLIQNHIFPLLTMVVISGCGHGNRELPHVMVDLNMVDRDSIPYSMFVDSITYLSLDPDKNCLIGEISNVAFLDSCIVVFESESSQVRLLNRDGKFLGNIGSRGAGNGEFIYPTQIDVDKGNNLILVYDPPQSAVLKYSVDNVYVGKDSIGHASDMAYLGNGRYLKTNYNDTPENSGVFLVDVAVGDSKKLSGCRDNVPQKKPWEIFRNDGKPAVMSRPYEDRLMEWEDDELVLIKNFNVLPSPSEHEMSVIENNPKEKLKHPNRMTFVKNKRWFYSYYWLDNTIKYIFMDDKTGEVTVTTHLNNDIDGIYGSELPVCINNSFLTVVDGKNESDNPRLQFLHLKR